ncbi:chemotaxis protein CheW [Methanosphaerula palustris]|uniref:CheW protein n=1 Tax=Methanosphaerula palustris (strain ATCC BAA-1556 / DSM 19958 / E1-9c) TaxID=521011 RepID=B8GHQ5_METPE|nr:chemotaxis protein CheW [Methanosphaerula palustris]ACL16660.1 CheW protein [Methanosphaerula palustris E1-9c]
MNQEEYGMVGGSADAETVRRILAERARALAQVEGEGAIPLDTCEILEFEMGTERYGIEVSEIREVLPLQQYTPLPCTPPFVFGIINVRGEIFSIVDLKKFFGLPDQGITNQNKVIILDNGSMAFGILADLIVGVRHVDTESLIPLPLTISSIGEEHLRGMTADGLIVLDGEKLLGDPRIPVHEEVDAGI